MKRAAAFAAVYLGWGSLYLAIRFGLESFPPFMLAAVGMLASGAVLHALSSFRNPAPSAHQWRRAAGPALLLVVLGNGAVVWGEQHVPSSVTAIILGTEALWMALLDWRFFKGPAPWGRALIGIGLGFAGTVLLVGFGLPEGTPLQVRGLCAVFIATLGWSLGSLVTREDPDPPGGAYSASMPMLLGGAVLAGFAVVSGEWRAFSFSGVTMRSAAALFHIIFVGSAAAYSAYVWLLKNVSLAKAATYAYVNPLVAVFLGWAVGGERVTLPMAGGSVLIIFSTMLILSQKEKASA